MLTTKKGKPRGGRYDHLYDARDEAELGDSRDDSADPRGDRDETVKDQVRRLSYDEAERDKSQYLELRAHVSLDKVAEFEGKRYRSDATLQWLKRFIYEMKGTRMPQNSWSEPFSLRLGRAEKRRYRQLPKKTQQRWSILSEAFLDYYCSQLDQSARTRYYSVRRKENEPICDFLISVNEYARTAKIQYEKGGADAAGHVGQFLLNCGDDCIMDLLYPLLLADIQRVEQISNKKILAGMRKKQRDRLVASRVGEGRRSDGPQPRHSVIGPLETATRLPVVAAAEITGQLAEMIGASANALTTETTKTAEMTTARGVTMIAENDAATRPSVPAVVLVQHAEATGTQHTSGIAGAISARRCMMGGAARCSSAWRNSLSLSTPPATSQRYTLTYTTSTSRGI
ncbi:unnamed protein product [Phytophthora fragariaefolia]|uniref:Unnamed protein product n=1 Tax=Phytophthora fragariaefolia TaxID=1490495 RepID=A0A9W6TYY3_9STRA|nr:unnamed protein product [Phytophthora fragariaefolia]